MGIAQIYFEGSGNRYYSYFPKTADFSPSFSKRGAAVAHIAILNHSYIITSRSNPPVEERECEWSKRQKIPKKDAHSVSRLRCLLRTGGNPWHEEARKNTHRSKNERHRRSKEATRSVALAAKKRNAAHGRL